MSEVHTSRAQQILSRAFMKCVDEIRKDSASSCELDVGLRLLCMLTVMPVTLRILVPESLLVSVRWTGSVRVDQHSFVHHELNSPYSESGVAVLRQARFHLQRFHCRPPSQDLVAGRFFRTRTLSTPDIHSLFCFCYSNQPTQW